MRSTSPEVLLAATLQRLTAAADALAADGLLTPPDVRSAANLLVTLVAAARTTRRTDVAWLLWTSVHGAFPTAEQLVSLRGRLRTDSDDAVAAWLLRDVLTHPHAGRPDLELTLVTAGAVVLVDFSARYDWHTGIHRVVRETVPRWAAAHGAVAVANTDEYNGLRVLAPREQQRVFDFGSAEPVSRAAEQAFVHRLVVPWRSVVIIPEIPDTSFAPVLATIGEQSGNEVAIIGYDMIPVTSADLRPDGDAVRFAIYLSAIKHVARVAAISASARDEFAGFAATLGAQGLVSPVVTEVGLAGGAPPAAARAAADRGTVPTVLCVGSREPHKNHAAVLHAAELLWRDGLTFRLAFLGGPGWKSEGFERQLARLAAAGRPVVDLGRLSDAELWQAYRDASITVFASLHEGFGLPVVESLSCGTPVVTSNYGSLAEIAADGGCLTVDPRDDAAIGAAMRTLLTDGEVHARLTAEASARTTKSWDTYAAEVWDVLVTAGSVA